MAARNEQATATVMLDGKQSADEMARLQAKAKDLTAQMRKLKDLNDKAGYDALQKELKDTNAEMKQLRINAFSVEAVMKNLSGASLKQLTLAQRALNKEIENTNRGTKEEQKQLALKQQQLKLVNAEIAKIKTNMQLAGTAQEGWLSKASAGFNKYLGLITAAGAAILGTGFSFKQAVDSSNQFNQNVAQLSSLTGLVGDDLNSLAQAAKDLSVTTTAEGVKITKSADDIVKAFTKVGGQRPELLKNKDALIDVTRQVLILAEAAQIDLDEAVLTVTATMNMFNMASYETPRIVNAIAAGSKAGGAEVDYLGTAILKAGTSFKMAGIPIEQAIGVIEGVQPAFASAEQAGTNLQSFLVKLEAQTNSKFKPSVVGLSAALDNLAAANLSTAQTQKLFGLENVDIATIMIANRDAIDNYTNAVTNTNTAVDQARITTATLQAAQKQEENQIKLNAIALGEVLAPAQLKATKAANALLDGIIKVVEWTKRNATAVGVFFKVILTGVSALVSYKLATIAAANAQTLVNVAQGIATRGYLAARLALEVLTGQTKLATAAQLAFKGAMSISGIGAIVSVIATAATAFTLFQKEAVKTVGLQKMLSDATIKTNDSIAEESAKVKDLFDQLRKTNPASKERKELIDKINSTYGTTLQNLKDEKEFLGQIDKAYNDLIATITRKIILESTAQTRVDLLKQQFTLEKQLIDLQNEAAKNPIGVPNTGIIFLQGELDKVKTALNGLDAIAKGIADKAGISLDGSTNLGNGGGGAPGVDPDAQDKALKQLQEYSKKVIDQQDKLYRDSLNLKDRQTAEIIARYAADIEFAAKYENDITDIGKEWHRVRVGLERNRDEEILRLNADHEKRLRDSFIAAKRDAGMARDEAYALDIAALQEKLAKEEITTDEYYLRLKTLQQKSIDEGLKLTEEALKKRNDLLAKYGIAKGDTQQSELAALAADAAANPEVFTTEVVEQAKLKIVEKYAKLRQDVEYNTQQAIADEIRNGIAIAQDVVGGFASFFADAKNAELEAAGDNEAKKKEITKRFANTELGIKIAQTLANMAMGIADIWAKYGANPVAATLLTALVSGQALGQISLAQAQRDKIQGYAAGYYNVQDQNGTPYNAAMGGRPTTQMVSKPTVFLAGEQGKNFPEMIIDGPTFKRLQINYPEAIAAINRSRIPGFAAGAYTPPQAPQGMALPPEFISLLNDLNNTLNKGITANLGWNQIKDKEYTANLIEKNFGTLPDRLN